MKYSLCKLRNKNLFNRRKYPSPNAMSIVFFLYLQLQLSRVFGYHLTIQSLTSRKQYTQILSGCVTGKSL